MIRFYLRYVLFMMTTLVVLSVGARVLGYNQPTNPALNGFQQDCEGKPQPCWFGIVPGETPTEDARSILSNLGYTSNNGLWMTDQPGLACTVEVQQRRRVVQKLILGVGCFNLRVGDVVNWAGIPVGVGGWRMFFGEGTVHAIVAQYPTLAYQNRCMDFRPTSPVTALDLQRPQVVESDYEPIRWRAALPYPHYVRNFGAWPCQSLMRAPF